MRQTLEEIKANNTDAHFIEKFKQLFSLSILFRDSIIGPTYSIPEKMIPNVALTSYGDTVFKSLKQKHNAVDDRIIKFALFVEFYHEELFVDVTSTDISSIERLLHAQILNSDILYPWPYGRLLYDKYFNEFKNPEDTLDNTDVLKLLQNTPQGVFQMGEYTTGPLGLIKQNPPRLIRPLRKLKLWHCSDPSCTAFHSVILSTSNTIIGQIINIIDDLLPDRFSPWSEFFNSFFTTEETYYDSDRPDLVPLLLINAFGHNELKLLLTQILDSHPDFRASLPNNKIFKGSSDSIVKNLSKEACFQILLLSESVLLINNLEKLIDKKSIIIPSTEIRKGKNYSPQGFYRLHLECNKLGVRAVTSGTNLGFVRLTNLLQEVYSEPSIRQQLEWNLRFYGTESLQEKLEAYILKENPQKIIKETILSGPLQISKTFSSLIGNFAMPGTVEEESYLVDKILWKLGFDVNIYPNTLVKFWEQLEAFKSTTIACNLINESDKDKIRSAAVNFWISLEEILERSLSFITWAILSDHFSKTHFKYNFEDARDFMCDSLDGTIIGSNGPLLFDKNGKNTLFPLTEGFSALIQICDNLLTDGPEKHKRHKNEMPSFYKKAKLTSFPFEHKTYLFDVKPNDFLKLREVLKSIPQEFAKHNVLSVRNRTQHKRDDFPSQDEILSSCTCVQTVIDKIERLGIFPNVYLFKCSQSDKFGRVFYEYEDYKKRSLVLKSPLQFAGSKVPFSKKYPLVILPIVNIGNSQEPLRFIFEENSNYLQFWKDFPRKKPKKLNEKEIASSLNCE